MLGRREMKKAAGKERGTVETAYEAHANKYLVVSNGAEFNPQ